MRALPRRRSKRARFSVHGINGLFRLSSTSTIVLQIPYPQNFALTGLVTDTVAMPLHLSPRECMRPAPAFAAETIFDALPFASMIDPFQGPGLRKHPGVGLTDLSHT